MLRTSSSQTRLRKLPVFGHSMALSALVLMSSCSDDTESPQPTDAGVNTSEAVARDAGPEETSVAVFSSSTSAQSAATSGSPTLPTSPDSGVESSTPVEPDSGTRPDETASLTPPPDAGLDATMNTSSEPEVPAVCANLPATPVTYEVAIALRQEAAGTRDFAFDGDGSMVSGDSQGNGNLIRVAKDGSVETWVSDIGLIRGVTVLPDGSAVFTAEDSSGVYLGRAHQGGGMFRLLSGLERASGVELGPDGLLYVAETNAGRVLRVNVETGAFTVAALGMNRPYRIAFAPDPSIMYVSSYEGEGIYKVVFSTPDGLGEVSVFSTSPAEPIAVASGVCSGKRAGETCSLSSGTGECLAVDGVLDCFRPEPCAELPSGADCSHYRVGICAAGACVDSCTGLTEGDECLVEGKPGACAANPWNGSLECQVISACQGKAAGDDCETNSGDPGVCDDSQTSDPLTCRERTECDLLGVGAECEDWGGFGVCTETGQCDTNPCSSLEAGDACIDQYSGNAGTCVEDEGTWCVPEDPCANHTAGATCTTGGEQGTCEADPLGLLVCWRAQCDGAVEGDFCLSASYQEGTCETEGEALTCVLPPPCAEAQEGDSCINVGVGNVRTEGTCSAADGGLVCGPPQYCANAAVGDPCQTSQDLGHCVQGEVGLECQVLCHGLEFGAACETEGAVGMCQMSYGGLGLTCRPRFPCESAEHGASCTGENGPGVCLEHWFPSPEFGCEPFSCDGQPDGALCALPAGVLGECVSDQCVTTPGNVYGLGADVCGNVYSTDMNSGNFWRISPEGQFELLAVLPTASLRSLQWGRDVGGFSSETVYVRDWDFNAIYGMQVGVPEASAQRGAD